MKMKTLMMTLLLIGALPLSMMAQDDDMYFVPTKENKAKEVKSYGMPSNTYYSGSSRSVDDYNRQVYSSVVPIDSAGNDIIDFSAVRGVYPDSTYRDTAEDYTYTRRMARFDDYTPTDAAYWRGYRDGSWASPWYYSSWYSWYDDPWYWGSPWYYSSYYTWYSPWHYGFYRPWYRGYYYYGPRYYYAGGRGGRYYASRPIRRTTYQSGRSFGRGRSNYSSNRLFGSTRSFSPSRSSSSFGGSRGFGGGGSFGGGRSGGGGGRSFGGRR